MEYPKVIGHIVLPVKVDNRPKCDHCGKVISPKGFESTYTQHIRYAGQKEFTTEHWCGDCIDEEIGLPSNIFDGTPDYLRME